MSNEIVKIDTQKLLEVIYILLDVIDSAMVSPNGLKRVDEAHNLFQEATNSKEKV